MTCRFLYSMKTGCLKTKVQISSSPPAPRSPPRILRDPTLVARDWHRLAEGIWVLKLFNMAAAVRICSCLRKISRNGSCFQRFAVQASAKAKSRHLSSSGAVYSASDGIESNPFYEKYAAKIKEIRDEIKEGRL